MTEAVKRWWEETSASFQAEIDLPVAVNWGGLGRLTEDDLNLLGDVAGVEAVELGCGGGQCSLALAERGADVTGVDLSRAQLEHARELAAERGTDADFLQGDITNLPLADERFDLAFNAYVLQWVGDLEAAFEEAHRVLRPGGRFVLSTPHPVYRVADPETLAVESSYFDTGAKRVETEGAAMVTYRHTVSGIHNALRDAGFDVQRLLEPGTSDPDAYEAGPWGERTPALMSRLPATLVVVARRPKKGG